MRKPLPKENAENSPDSVHLAVVETLKDHLSLSTDSKDPDAKVYIDGKSLDRFILDVVMTYQMITAAEYFVTVSRIVTDIAQACMVTPEDIRAWAKTPDWKRFVRSYGWQGDVQPIEDKRELSVPVPLHESFLLTNVFQKYCDVRLVTYDGIVDTRIKTVRRYDLILEDSRIMKKIDVILAFPKDRMSYVKKGIKRRKNVADLGLKAIQRRSERPKIEGAARIGDPIECVMRDGLVITGENIWVSKYNIVMRVGGKKGAGGKVVLVYKHALHGFRVLQQTQERPTEYHDDWAEEEDSQ